MRISQAGFALAVLGMWFFWSAAAEALDVTGKVRAVAVPGGGKPVAARIDKTGAIHVLFDSAFGPKYVKSTDNGLTFGPAISVVSGESRPAGLAFSGWDLAVGKSGRVHVAMGDECVETQAPAIGMGVLLRIP